MAGTKSGSLWESPEFLGHLLLAFHDLVADAGALTTEKKDHIAASLHEHGFNMTWNAVRQHVAKLRKAHETSKTGSTPNTPKKTPAKRAAPGSGRGKKNTAPAVKPPQTEEMDDDQNAFEKELKLFKAESMDDEMGMNGEQFENPYKRPKTEASFEEASLGEA